MQSRAQMNLGAGPGVAVREFATASGPVDYALFVDRQLCGVIEAKPEGTTLSGFSDQAARYMEDVPAHLLRQADQVRFEYVASGTEAQFRDHADPTPRSRRVFTIHRPETLLRWRQEAATIREQLQHLPNLATHGLRDCQIDGTQPAQPLCYVHGRLWASSQPQIELLRRILSRIFGERLFAWWRKLGTVAS